MGQIDSRQILSNLKRLKNSLALYVGGGSGILNHESRLKIVKKVKKSEGIRNHIIWQAVKHGSLIKYKCIMNHEEIHLNES